MPAPYMVDRFNALVDRDELEFEAWFNERRGTDRSWEVDETTWKFRYRYLPSVSVAGRTFRWPAPLFGPKPDLIISLYAEPVFVVGWMISRLRRVPTGFRVLRTFDSWVRRSFYKDFIKRLMFRAADAIETPGPDGRAFAIACGARPEKIFECTHTVNPRFFEARQRISDAERIELLSSLGLSGVVFTYVGRLWKGKGLEILLQAYKAIREQQGADVRLMLVGDGPDELELRELCRQDRIEGVVFTGFLESELLPQYLAASDVFVFPTLGDPYGLVVDEALASGLPVIATSAAGEIRDRVHDGVNGFVVESGVLSSLTERMAKLYEDADMRRSMATESTRIVEGKTPDKWAGEFCDLIRRVTAKPRRFDARVS